MKLTKKQLKQIIKEELEEGLRDRPRDIRQLFGDEMDDAEYDARGTLCGFYKSLKRPLERLQKIEERYIKRPTEEGYQPIMDEGNTKDLLLVVKKLNGMVNELAPECELVPSPVRSLDEEIPK